MSSKNKEINNDNNNNNNNNNKTFIFSNGDLGTETISKTLERRLKVEKK